MRLRTLCWLLSTAALCLLLAAATPALARETARVGQVKGIGLGSAEIEAIQSLLENEIISHPDVELVDGAADIVVDASVTRLANEYVVILHLLEANGERRSRKHKIRTFDEIDVAIQRLLAALVEGVSVEDTAERGAVLETEQELPTRVRSIAGWKFSAGGAWGFSDALGTNKTMYALALGYAWDVMDLLVELRTDYQFGYNELDVFALSGTLGMSYVWYDNRRFGLFSGAEAGFGYVHGEDKPGTSSRAGFAFAFHTGALLLRHADINVDIRFRTMILADRVNGEVPVLGMALAGVHW